MDKFLIRYVILFVCFNADLTQTAIILLPAREAIFSIGDTALLSCHTTINYPVLWQYSKDMNSPRQSIFRRNLVINGFRNRITADVSLPNTYKLELKNLQLSDSGVYHCLEDDGLGPDEQYLVLKVVIQETTSTRLPDVSESTVEYLEFHMHDSNPGSQTDTTYYKRAFIVCLTIAVIIAVLFILQSVIFVVYCVRQHQTNLQRDCDNRKADVENQRKTSPKKGNRIAQSNEDTAQNSETKLLAVQT